MFMVSALLATIGFIAPEASMCCVCSRGTDSGANLVSFSNATGNSCEACCAATGAEYGRSVSASTCSSGKSISELTCNAPNAPEPFCCTSCSAGGCSAFYSPTAVAPYACSKGEKIVDLPDHGKTCQAPSTQSSYLGTPSQLALLASVAQSASTICACHGPTWTEIDDGSGHAGGAITGHCYDKLCIDNKEAHWEHPLSDCAARGAQKPFCPPSKCACHGSTWMEIDDGPSGMGGHCYDKVCLYNKEAHWQHPISDCARVGAMKPFC